MTEEDEAAFDEFVAARGTALLRTATLVCGATRHDAEDLVQHALEKVYRHWRRIRHDNPEAYARRVVVNAAISRQRRRRVVREITFARPPDTPAVSPDLDLRDTGPAAGATGETTATASARILIVPDVVGMTLTDAVAELRRGGLTADVATAVQGTGIVTGQAPGQGKPLPAGGRVTLSARAILSDFDAQGRRFDGVHIGYLPDGLMWTKRDEKVHFGKQAADLTTFEIPHKPQGQFAVRVAVYRGQVSEEIQRRLAAFTAHGGQNIEINGETAYLVNNSGGGTNVLDPADDDAEPLIGWRLRDGLAVEVYMSPSYARQIDYRAELRKIAENIRPDD